MKSVLPALIPQETTFQPRTHAMEQCDFERELERLHGESWGWALACCARDRDLAEDVLQTAYLRIISGRARFNGDSSLKTWVFGVIRFTARAERRRRFLWLKRASWSQTDVDDSTESADSTTEDTEQQERLLIALRALSPRQREILQLVFYHDLTIEDAARVMGVSVGSARTHYDRGKKAMAQLLRADGKP